MTSNPFDGRRAEPAPKIDRAFLEAYAEKLNAMGFSRANGWHWRVSERDAGGKIVPYLDRFDGRPQ